MNAMYVFLDCHPTAGPRALSHRQRAGDRLHGSGRRQGNRRRLVETAVHTQTHKLIYESRVAVLQPDSTCCRI